MSMEAVVLIAVVAVAVAVNIAFFWYNHRRTKMRRESLRRDDTLNVWFWVDGDGRKKSSKDHPGEASGTWHSEANGSGSSDGGGGE